MQHFAFSQQSYHFRKPSYRFHKQVFLQTSFKKIPHRRDHYILSSSVCYSSNHEKRRKRVTVLYSPRLHRLTILKNKSSQFFSTKFILIPRFVFSFPSWHNFSHESESLSLRITHSTKYRNFFAASDF